MSQSLEQGKRKLTAKDAITAGALGAVCIAIRFLFMLVGGVSPYVWFATHFIDAILIGPVFMLMVAKVQKNGPFLLTSLITGVVLVAATWMFPITGLVGGILCELCLRAGQFRQKGWLMLGFFCFNLGFIGDFLPLWFTKESYLEYAAQMMDAGYMATMEGLLTWPVFGVIVLSILVGSVLGSLLGMKLMRKHFVKQGRAGPMRKNIRPSFLDPRTKILIWLLANVVVFTWSPAVFQLSVMIAYLILFLVERKGTMLAGLLATYLAILAIQYWLLPLLPGSLATVFATVTYFILVFPCIAGGAYLIATTSVSQFIAALEGMGAPRSFSITLAVTLRFLPSLRQDLRHIRDAMALRNIRGFEEKLECIYVPMLMGAAQTAEELSESATARGIESPGKMSSWRPIGFHIQDVVVTLLFLALCVGGICCKGVLP